jgi:sigma-B regulation protein RsbQ
MTNILQRNNVTIKGKGEKVMLFAHGFGCDQNAWRKISNAFADDYKLMLLDFVGAGKSDISAYDKKKYSTLNGYADDILEICHELKIENAIFIGHSVSCMIGALASIKEPAVFKKLIFIGPSPCYLNGDDYSGGFDQEDLDNLFEIMNDDYTTWSKTMAPKIMGDKQGEELKEELTESFCSTDPEIAKAFAKVTFLSDNRKDLAHIPVESLTLQCSEDIIAPLQVGKYINENTPNNKMIILNATGHCPHMSAPAETIAAIKSFL